MDPVAFYFGDDKIDKLSEMILSVDNGGPPVEVWADGVKVAMIITPEEFDLLNRLIAQES